MNIKLILVHLLFTQVSRQGADVLGMASSTNTTYTVQGTTPREAAANARRMYPELRFAAIILTRYASNAFTITIK